MPFAARIHDASASLTTSATVTGLPTTGGSVWVRLYTQFASGWQSTDYSDTAWP